MPSDKSPAPCLEFRVICRHYKMRIIENTAVIRGQGGREDGTKEITSVSDRNAAAGGGGVRRVAGLSRAFAGRIRIRRETCPGAPTTPATRSNSSFTTDCRKTKFRSILPPTNRPSQDPPTSSNWAELLTTDSQIQLENATEALEQIAETIVTGLETPVPDQVSAPEPVPPVPVAPQPQAGTVLTAPAPGGNTGAKSNGHVLAIGRIQSAGKRAFRA